MKKIGNLFSRIATTMAPDVWTKDGEHLLPEIKEQALKIINSYIPKEAIKQIVVLGTITGLQWEKDSDIDVNVILDPPELVKELWEVRRAHNGTLAKGTKHEINIYLQPFTGKLPQYQDSFFGVYDVINNKWLVRPPARSKYRNPEEKFWAEIAVAKMMSNEFIRRADNYIRSLNEKEEAIQRGYNKWSLASIEAKILRDFNKLAEFIDDMQYGRDFTYNWGWGIPRENYENVLYKYIHYMLPDQYEEILKEVEQLHHKSKYSDENKELL